MRGTAPLHIHSHITSQLQMNGYSEAVAASSRRAADGQPTGWLIHCDVFRIEIDVCGERGRFQYKFGAFIAAVSEFRQEMFSFRHQRDTSTHTTATATTTISTAMTQTL